MFCVVLGCGRFALGRMLGSRLSFGEPYASPDLLIDKPLARVRDVVLRAIHGAT